MHRHTETSTPGEEGIMTSTEGHGGTQVKTKHDTSESLV